jgi:hypothetical protein
VRLLSRLNYAAVNSQFVGKHFYPLLSRHFGGDDLVFLSLGYEEDPPMAVPLDTTDEPNRFFIQLYHRTATQVDLTSKSVLEVSCGHGGGASYLARTLGPASYTGQDLNPAGIDSGEKGTNCPTWIRVRQRRKSTVCRSFL